MRTPQLKMRLSLRGMMLLVAVGALCIWGIGTNNRFQNCMNLAEDCRFHAANDRKVANQIDAIISQNVPHALRLGPGDKRTPQEIRRDMKARSRYFMAQADHYDGLAFRYILAGYMPFLPMPSPQLFGLSERDFLEPAGR